MSGEVISPTCTIWVTGIGYCPTMSDDTRKPDLTPEQLAEASRLFQLMTELSPQIKAIAGVASKASAVSMAKRRFIVHLKKDSDEVKQKVKALIASRCELEVDFVVPAKK